MAWDVGGKTILVTGASSGIGLQASLDLARRGARVVMVGRDPRRTAQAVAEVKTAAGSSQVSGLICDLGSQSAIRLLANTFRSGNDRLDVLVNNAGGVNKTRTTTVDGIEATFAVNHLGPFLLTNLLLDLIIKSAPARVVTVASVGHLQGTLDFNDLGFAHGYSIMRAYSRSKLANVLFASELARRLEGTGVTSNCLHPGSVDTRIWSGAPWWAKPFIQIVRPFFISAETGAGYVVALVTRPEFGTITGRYFDKDVLTAPSALAQDPELGRRLWEVSAAMVGVR
jgi:NAD(P)-dependent dehydrogenase (short-subunit alcohol dehydrogenase family)